MNLTGGVGLNLTAASRAFLMVRISFQVKYLIVKYYRC